MQMVSLITYFFLSGPMLSLLEFLQLQKLPFCNAINIHGSARTNSNLLLIRTDGSSLSHLQLPVSFAQAATAMLLKYR